MAEQAVPIKAGQKAPAFDLESSTGERIRLADFARKRDAVLYFYPKADTPGCTKQACAFRDARAAYEKANVAVGGPLCSNNGDLLVEAAVAGAGLILQPEFLAARHITAGRLVPVLPQWQEFPEISLYALYPATRRVPATVRALVDYLVTALPPAMAAAVP